MISALRTFGPFVRTHRRLLVVGGVLALLQVVVGLAEPWPLRLIVDHVLAEDPAPFLGISHRRSLLALAVGALVGIIGLAALLDYGAKRLLATAGLRISTDVRGAVFSHLQRLSLGFHTRQRVGDLSTRVTGDVDRAQDMLVQALAVIGPNLMMVVGMFTVMMAMDPEFTMITLLLVPVLALAVHRSTVQLKASSRRARKADGQVAAAATETLGMIGVVQAFGLERHQRATFDRLTSDSLRAGLESARVQARFSPLVDITAALSTAVVLWVGATRVLDGRLSLGALLVFVAYIGSLYKPLKALSRLSTSFAKGTASAERVQDLLDRVPDVRDHPNGLAPRRTRGWLEFEGVWADHGDGPVIRGVDLEVAPGETVALVGRTGAGKSTLVSLVPRLMDPSAGCISLDGLDLRRYRLEALRGSMALVSQDCVLLRGTLADNIRLGRPGATDAEVRRAARLALVDEFAARLPLGLDTPVGERGADLSGGQRQRIAIARAIVRDAPVLLLDEPTSALDARSEEALVQALAALPRGRTTLVVAHRLSTVRDADRVVVLEDGQVVQHGAPCDLAEVSGPWRELVRASDGPRRWGVGA